jgi:hypothetical protein
VHPRRAVAGVHGGALWPDDGEDVGPRARRRHGRGGVQGHAPLRVHRALPDTTEEDDGDEKVVAMAQNLLVAADRYGIDRLRLICEDKLCGYVDARNVGTILALAEQHHCNGLKRACFKFLMSGNNLKAAVATTGFEHLFNSCPSVLKELLAKASTLLPD